VDAVPHDGVLFASRDRRADAERELAPKCDLKQLQDLKAFLVMGKVGRATRPIVGASGLRVIRTLNAGDEGVIDLNGAHALVAAEGDLAARFELGAHLTLRHRSNADAVNVTAGGTLEEALGVAGVNNAVLVEVVLAVGELDDAVVEVAEADGALVVALGGRRVASQPLNQLFSQEAWRIPRRWGQ